MAQTGTSQLSNMVPAELVSAQILECARSARPALQLVATDTLQGSNVKSYTRFVKVTAAALTQGTDGTATAMSDSQVSGTQGEIGIGVNLTDSMRSAAASPDIQRQIALELGYAFADKVDIDLLAVSTSLTDVVGSTGVNLTEDVYYQGIYESIANDIAGRPLACILHPKQAYHLRIALGGVTENQSAIYSRPDMLSAFSNGTRPNGYSLTMHGVDIFESTNVPSANSAVDSAGMFLVYGPDSPIMLTVANLDGAMWFGRTEFQRDASGRWNEIWVTGSYSVAVVAPERGCRVLSTR